MKVTLEAQHAVGHPQPRGVGHYSINLIQALLRRNAFEYGLTFFDFNREAGNRRRAENLFADYGVPFYECNTLDYRVASRDDSVWEKSYNEWTNTNSSVYHFMSPVTVPFKLSGKMVVTIHDISWAVCPGMISAHQTALLQAGMSRINRVQPFIITDSKSTFSQVLEFTTIPPEKIKVVYLSYDEIHIYPDKTDVSSIVDGDYILYLGAFEANKNIVRIIEAFNCIAERNKELKLVLAGKPVWDAQYSEQINCAIDNSPFKNRIILPGYVDAYTKRKLISNALCFIFPSICEGFGIPVLEAMACGCPIITADNTSLPEVGGDAAVYVDAYNTEQLAYEMERVITSDILRKDMIAKGFVQAKKFSWDKNAEQVENVYRMVAEC